MSPLRRTSLAPAGHTPVLPVRAKHRQKVSLLAALIRTPSGHGRLRHEMLIDRYFDDWSYAQFLHDRIVRPSRRPVILVQDNASFHSGDFTQDLIQDAYPRLLVYQLPPYAPELNPTEQLWNWARYQKLANYVPQNLGDLAAAADHVVKLAAKDQFRIQSFFDGGKLRW